MLKDSCHFQCWLRGHGGVVLLWPCSLGLSDLYSDHSSAQPARSEGLLPAPTSNPSTRLRVARGFLGPRVYSGSCMQSGTELSQVAGLSPYSTLSFLLEPSRPLLTWMRTTFLRNKTTWKSSQQENRWLECFHNDCRDCPLKTGLTHLKGVSLWFPFEFGLRGACPWNPTGVPCRWHLPVSCPSPGLLPSTLEGADRSHTGLMGVSVRALGLHWAQEPSGSTLSFPLQTQSSIPTHLNGLLQGRSPGGQREQVFLSRMPAFSESALTGTTTDSSCILGINKENASLAQCLAVERVAQGPQHRESQHREDKTPRPEHPRSQDRKHAPLADPGEPQAFSVATPELAHTVPTLETVSDGPRDRATTCVLERLEAGSDDRHSAPSPLFISTFTWDISQKASKRATGENLVKGENSTSTLTSTVAPGTQRGLRKDRLDLLRMTLTTSAPDTADAPASHNSIAKLPQEKPTTLTANLDHLEVTRERGDTSAVPTATRVHCTKHIPVSIAGNSHADGSEERVRVHVPQLPEGESFCSSLLQVDNQSGRRSQTLDRADPRSLGENLQEKGSETTQRLQQESQPHQGEINLVPLHHSSANSREERGQSLGLETSVSVVAESTVKDDSLALSSVPPLSDSLLEASEKNAKCKESEGGLMISDGAWAVSDVVKADAAVPKLDSSETASACSPRAESGRNTRAFQIHTEGHEIQPATLQVPCPQQGGETIPSENSVNQSPEDCGRGEADQICHLASPGSWQRSGNNSKWMRQEPKTSHITDSSRSHKTERQKVEAPPAGETKPTSTPGSPAVMLAFTSGECVSEKVPEMLQDPSQQGSTLGRGKKASQTGSFPRATPAVTRSEEAEKKWETPGSGHLAEGVRKKILSRVAALRLSQACGPVDLKLEQPQDHPGDLLKHWLLGPTPDAAPSLTWGESFSSYLGPQTWRPRLLIPHQQEISPSPGGREDETQTCLLQRVWSPEMLGLSRQSTAFRSGGGVGRRDGLAPET
ncbi:Alpha-protein kinase 2 [Camelus dromedarius]|uniref:Alpha-protein kinase 2 n=1 Tax=Camelus dromedarius TaxID=9838 RepID=A0A5N4CC34_CAMDR|nr:Alpha-protein kinase 2 [Camelus dromedarius]